MPPIVSQDLGYTETNAGGWISGLYDYITKKDIHVTIVCPGKKASFKQESNWGYYVYDIKQYPLNRFNKKQEKYFADILSEVKPDIIQLFGSEYASALIMMNACIKLGYQNRVILHIQGLVSIYQKHLFGVLPARIIFGSTIRNIIKHDNVYQARNEMRTRGKYEKELISKLKYVTGRTEWDIACTKLINPNIKYFHCNESLRPSFYCDEWSIESCRRHSIFLAKLVA